jgi:hypothetical protein
MTATLQLSSRRVRHYCVDAAIGTLLAELGLEYSTANFWTENSFILDEILHDAFVAYRDRIVQVQPRESGDDGSEASELNALWSEIKRRFHQHMHPQISPKAPTQRKSAAYNGGKFLRHCLFDKCGQQFFTEIKNKVYCCDDHRLRQKRKNAIRKVQASRNRSYRFCALPGCRGKFVAVENSRSKGKLFHSPLCANKMALRMFRDRNRKG